SNRPGDAGAKNANANNASERLPRQHLSHLSVRGKIADTALTRWPWPGHQFTLRRTWLAVVRVTKKAVTLPHSVESSPTSPAAPAPSFPHPDRSGHTTWRRGAP